MKDPRGENHLLTIAGINATILGILIALVSGYALYLRQIIDESEMKVITAAEGINNVFFNRSCYFPEGKPGQWAENVRKLVQMERDKAGVPTSVEGKRTQLSEIKGSGDIEELARYLHFLVNPFWPTDQNDDGYDLGNRKYVPRDPANRGEEILTVLNLLAHNHLFPDPPFETRGAFSKDLQRRLYYETVQDVEDWLAVVDSFVFAYKGLLYEEFCFPQASWIKELQKRDAQLIRRWESSPLLLTFGHLNPSYLIEDFNKNAQKVVDVSERTHYELNRYLKLVNRFPSAKVSGFVLIFLAAMLVLGVVAPVCRWRIPALLYKSIPLYSAVVVYVFIAILLVWK